MGDLGWLDDDARLWFCGRKSQRVRCADGDRYTVACEGIFNAHPNVLRSALVGVGPAGQQRAVLWVERDREEDERRPCSDSDLRRELLAWAQKHERTRCIDVILFHPSFPVDIRHNAKIGREALARRAEKQNP
jgi:acyl-coenzyme A synthetase/AMP-(fatty) acid ligase